MSSSGKAASSGSSLPLGAAYQDPAGTVTFNNNSQTFAAVDTTNLRVTFTAPANGIVIVKFGCFLVPVSGDYGLIGVLEGSTVLGTALGTSTSVAAIIDTYVNGSCRVTGLSAGSHSYDLATASAVGGSNVAAKYGGGKTSAGFGPAFIEVWAGI